MTRYTYPVLNQPAVANVALNVRNSVFTNNVAADGGVLAFGKPVSAAAVGNCSALLAIGSDVMIMG